MGHAITRVEDDASIFGLSRGGIGLSLRVMGRLEGAGFWGEDQECGVTRKYCIFQVHRVL